MLSLQTFMVHSSLSTPEQTYFDWCRRYGSMKITAASRILTTAIIPKMMYWYVWQDPTFSMSPMYFRYSPLSLINQYSNLIANKHDLVK